MAQVVVRNIDDDVKARLKQRAAQHGWSMEEEVRQILRKAVAEPRQAAVKLGSRMAARFAGAGLSSELPQLQGQTAVPMDFDR
jgi:plasmid stability protein